MFKNFFKKHIISLRTLLLLILAATILYYSLNPDKVIQKGKLETQIEYSPERMRRFVYLPNYDNFTCMMITPLPYGLKIHVRDFVTGYKPEVTMGDLAGDVVPWWDEEEECVRIVVHQRDSDLLQLLTIRVDENLNMRTERTPLWRNPPITAVYDSTVVVNGLTFHPTVLIDSARAMDLIKENDGYRIGLSRSMRDSLNFIWAPSIDRIEEIHQLAAIVSEKTNIPFETKDVYRILQTFYRNSWYKSRFIESGLENYADYGIGRIEGAADCNGDGKKELLIATHGERYLETTMGCYDVDVDSLLWRFITAGGCTLAFAADIDHDGRDEIGVGTCAPANQMSPYWHEHPEMGTTAISYFYVLDDDGSIFRWGNQPAKFEIGGFGSMIYADYDEPTNSALIVENTNMDYREKKFLQLHLDNGKIDSLQTYHSIRYSYGYNGSHCFWDWKEGMVTPKRFSPGLVYHQGGTYPLANSPQHRYKSPLMIDGEPHFVSYPFQILDEDFNVLYESVSLTIEGIDVHPNRLLFVNVPDGAKIGFLVILSFSKSTCINPVALLLIGFELLLLAIWWAVHSFIMAPIASADKGYIVLWSILGRLYIWKPLGKASIYKLPKYIAFDKRYFSSSVGSLSRDFRCIFQRRLFLMDFTVYELEKVNELAVVQQIAHELKNRLLVMQYSVDDDSEEAKADLRESLDWSTKAAKMVSDFSRIHTLNKEPHDIRDIIEEVTHSLMARPHFELLELDLSQEPLMVAIDGYLMKMALRNLIENALQAIDENGWVKVSAAREDDAVIIQLYNPGHIDDGKIKQIMTKGDFSSKPDGTGVGVSIARIIVSNHEGTLEMTCDRDVVKVLMRLPVQ